MNLSVFVSSLKKRLNEHKARLGLTYFDEYDVTVSETPKYFKIYSFEVKDGKRWRNDGGTNIKAFIDKKTGDIYKPASWKAPAKHARGNVLSSENGMEAFDESGFVKYLR